VPGTVSAPKIAPSTKFLPFFDGVVRETVADIKHLFADLGSVLHLVY
jgi:hypothetical protein